MNACKGIMGRINSFQSLGAVDGPGLRYVVFMQGCPLRCKCCHNPDTWDTNGGEEYSVSEVLKRVQGCRNYFRTNGGITVSGGEPLLQKEFVTELFRACKRINIHTALDTSGCITENIDELLEVTDICLLDYKMTNAKDYKRYTGCDIEKPTIFMHALAERKIKTWVRQVIIPGLNDSLENADKLLAFAAINSHTERIELLPFKKLCSIKYQNMGIPFGFSDKEEAGEKEVRELQNYLDRLYRDKIRGISK